MNAKPSFQEELCFQYMYEKSGSNDTKDIIIVIHDQLDFVKKCIEAVFTNTGNFTLYLWDNGSMAPTREYLEEVAQTHENVVLVRHFENLGFIKPNNNMAVKGNSPYIILLNSDTEVMKGWDTALIGWLKENQNCKVVGYQGGTLDANGKGSGKNLSGNLIDYVCGWCLCIDRNTYNKYGLFDEYNLKFAYGEDSDLSLRIKEAGFEVYAMYIKLVKHYGNVTSLEVQREIDTTESFENNHNYIQNRWKLYLETRRVDRTMSLT